MKKILCLLVCLLAVTSVMSCQEKTKESSTVEERIHKKTDSVADTDSLYMDCEEDIEVSIQSE